MFRINVASFSIAFNLFFYSNISIAIETATTDNNYDYTIGVCHLIDNRPEMKLTAYNIINPLRSVIIFFIQHEGKRIQLGGSTSLIVMPKYGVIDDESDGYYGYSAKKHGYKGLDYAEFVIKNNELKIKVKYTFNVMNKVPGGELLRQPC